MRLDQKEQAQHGDLLFHMRVYQTRTYKNDPIVLFSHWHEELELLVITKGRARVQLNSSYYNVQEGEFVIIPPHTLHGAYSLGEEVVEFFAIVIHADFLASFIHDLINKNYISPLFEGTSGLPLYVNREAEHTMACLPLLIQIKETYENKGMGYELLIKAKAYELLYKLYVMTAKDDYNHHLNRKTETQQMGVMRSIIQYIHDHYQEKVTLNELAEVAHMSKGYFCKLFHKLFTMTPMAYLINLRISQAAHLIVSTDKKLSDIALSTGFSNVNYFTIAFKKVFHCTPSEFKRNTPSLFSEKKTI